MNPPQMFDTLRVAPDTSVLPAYLPVPGLGVLPVNSFLIHGSEPILIDSGLASLADDFMASLEACIDPGDLCWIWITHADMDHVGNLSRVLARAPRARIITTYLGMGKLGLVLPVPPERVYLLNPGQTLVAGDRTLTAFKPPLFDAPETTGLVDGRTGVMFTSDAFGSVLSAPRESAREISPDELGQGVATWASVDAPWLHRLSAEAFEQSLVPVTSHRPDVILSAHLPPAVGMTHALLEHLRAARLAPPFVGPDQEALVASLSAA